MSPTPAGRERRGSVYESTPMFGSTAYGALNYVELLLTNVEIKALRATPKLLLNAPGLGRMMDVMFAQLELKAGANVLSESAANLDFRYVGKASGVIVTSEMTGFIDQATDQVLRVRPSNDKVTATANHANLGVELFNNGAGEFAGNAAADATLRVRLWYTVLPI